ncbi:MAG TPA: hypothetical protein VEQ66_10780 [Propionibacteriaceae bacterium]|nr:hypothetical protein [Propionibacteriaceae bacterium]
MGTVATRVAAERESQAAHRWHALGLTARRFLDLGRTESMICPPVA